MADRAAATAGFVLAGVAFAGALAGWPGGLGPVGAVLSAAALAVFALRRYGRLEPGTPDAVAAAGGLGAAATSITAVIGSPVAGGPGTQAVGATVTAIAGVGAAVLAYADWQGVDGSRLAGMASRTLSATAIGLAGLIAIVAWSVVIGGIYRFAVGDIDPAVGAVLSAVALGLGTGTVAWLYLQGSRRGVSFIDLRRPTRRDAAYVLGGVVVLVAVNLAIGWAFQQVGLPAARHSLFDIARDDPELLLVLIPLSFLIIGPGEELLYRNVVQKSLYDAFSRRGAIAVASAIFAAAHVPAYSSAGSTPLSVLNTLSVVFALSVVLGVVFDRTRNVLVPALVHGSFNAIAFAATYAQLVG